MTPRERNLLIVFFIALGAAALVVGLGSYWEGLSVLDEQYLGLQKRALRVTQTELLTKAPQKTALPLNLKDRFFAPGSLPSPLALAGSVQSALQSSGLAVLESRVLETSESSQWVQYMAQGDISSWFRFLQMLHQQDGRALFRSLSLVKKQELSYSITFEVGHVVLP